MLRDAIDGCKIEIFHSNLQQPSPLRQSQRPATSVNEPLGSMQEMTDNRDSRYKIILHNQNLTKLHYTSFNQLQWFF